MSSQEYIFEKSIYIVFTKNHSYSYCPIDSKSKNHK